MEYHITNLSDTQKDALSYANKKCKIFSKESKILLFNKINKIKPELLNSEIEQIILGLKEWIKNNTEITINFRTLNIFNSDKYKSCFELLNTRDETYRNYRNKKENALFNNCYTNAKNNKRIKYGGLNILNEMLTQNCTKKYGENVLVLKNYMQKFATFINGNSEYNISHLGNYKYPYSLLYNINDELLLELINCICQKKIKYSKYSKYIEVQIHTDVVLKQDIKKIILKKLNYNKNKKLVDDFLLNTDIKLVVY
jgi:hypothetical protein